MDPGEFDTLVSIVMDGETGRDAAGAPIVARVEVAKAWAKMTAQGGREFLSGDGQVTERKVVFRAYEQAGITTDMVVVAKGSDHEIVDVQTSDGIMVLFTVGKAAGK